jgi:hypothetical protein
LSGEELVVNKQLNGMLKKKKHIFNTNLTNEEVIKKLEFQTEYWEKDNSKKKFVGKIDQKGFNITPILKNKKNGLLPRFSGRFTQNNGQIIICSELNKPQRVLIYCIVFFVIPAYIISITLNCLPITRVEKIIFGGLLLINLIILKIAYAVNLNRSLNILKNLWE